VLPKLKRLSSEIDPLLLLSDTLTRWLDGGPCYGSGPVPDGSQVNRSKQSFRLLDDDYLMSGVAAIGAIADLLSSDWEQRGDWYRNHRDAFLKQLQLLRQRDADSDGLIESSQRTGNAGEGCWSTCWYDVISFGFKDAFSNALLHSALQTLAKALPTLNEGEVAEECDGWANQIKAVYAKTFMNPKTGWLAGWRSADGQLHDYAFLFVNGSAVRSGLLDRIEAGAVVRRLYDEMQRIGPPDFRLGLPGNLWQIPDEDLAAPQRGLPMGFYQNGGLTHSQARHFLSAMYDTGMQKEADLILCQLCESLADGSAFGGCGTGVDWRRWDGAPAGYEGLLTDQFGVIGMALERFGCL
jgi:hypothetical protein